MEIGKLYRNRLSKKPGYAYLWTGQSHSYRTSMRILRILRFSNIHEYYEYWITCQLILNFQRTSGITVQNWALYSLQCVVCIWVVTGMNEQLVQYVVTQHCCSVTSTATLQEKEDGLFSTASSSNKGVLYYSKFNRFTRQPDAQLSGYGSRSWKFHRGMLPRAIKSTWPYKSLLIIAV